MMMRGRKRNKASCKVQHPDLGDVSNVNAQQRVTRAVWGGVGAWNDARRGAREEKKKITDIQLGNKEVEKHRSGAKNRKKA